jgi:hypothetical protein
VTSHREHHILENIKKRDVRNAYTILVGKSEGKGKLARPRRRWDDNIRLDLRKGVGRCELDSSGGG